MFDLDWEATWQANFWEDFHQTVYFSRQGVDEINPFYAGMVKRKDYTLLAAAWLFEYKLSEAWAGKSKARWQMLGLWRLIVVGLNSWKHDVGIPVVTIRF